MGKKSVMGVLRVDKPPRLLPRGIPTADEAQESGGWNDLGVKERVSLWMSGGPFPQLVLVC